MKKILVTGCTDGIGTATASLLAGQGHELWLHGRSEKRVSDTVKTLIEKHPTAKLHPVIFDLSDFESVRTQGQSLAQSLPQLDVLINNAGVYMREFRVANCGVEMTMTVNHLGHFLLTNLLKQNLFNSKNPRVITVSSIAQAKGHLDPENFSMTKSFDHYQAYAASKLANVLFAKKLAREWKSHGFASYSLHPGVITTKMLKTAFNMTGASVESGAATSVWLASDEKISAPSGTYFENQKPKEPLKAAEDEKLQDLFWNWSAEKTGISEQRIETSGRS